MGYVSSTPIINNQPFNNNASKSLIKTDQNLLNFNLQDSKTYNKQQSKIKGGDKDVMGV